MSRHKRKCYDAAPTMMSVVRDPYYVCPNFASSKILNFQRLVQRHPIARETERSLADAWNHLADAGAKLLYLSDSFKYTLDDENIEAVNDYAKANEALLTLLRQIAYDNKLGTR